MGMICVCVLQPYFVLCLSHIELAMHASGAVLGCFLLGWAIACHSWAFESIVASFEGEYIRCC